MGLVGFVVDCFDPGLPDFVNYCLVLSLVDCKIELSFPTVNVLRIRVFIDDDFDAVFNGGVLSDVHICESSVASDFEFANLALIIERRGL